VPSHLLRVIEVESQPRSPQDPCPHDAMAPRLGSHETRGRRVLFRL